MLNLALVKDLTLIYRLVYLNLSDFESRTGSLAGFMHTFRVFCFLYTSHMSHGHVALCEVTNRWWRRAEIDLLSQNHSLRKLQTPASLVSRRPGSDVVSVQCVPPSFHISWHFTVRMTMLLKNRENRRKKSALLK